MATIPCVTSNKQNLENSPAEKKKMESFIIYLLQEGKKLWGTNRD